jgi:hypothetical protein
VTLDGTVPDAFIKIAEDIEAIAVEARRFVEGDPCWTADSEAGKEAASEADFADDSSNSPVQHVLLTAASTIGMAVDHLVAMAAAIHERTLFAPITLSRTVLAATGTAFYLLEPDIGIRDRLARGWTQQLAAHTQTMAIFSDDPTGRGFTHVRSLRDAIKASAERHDFRVTSPPWNSRSVRGSIWYIESRPPSEGKLIADVLSSSGVGGTLYRHTSAFVYAQPHALAFMITRPAQLVRPGSGQGVLGYGIDRLLLYVMGSVTALHAVILRACELFGRSSEDWLSTYRPIILKWAQWSGRLRGNGMADPGDLARELGLWVPPGAAT